MLNGVLAGAMLGFWGVFVGYRPCFRIIVLCRERDAVFSESIPSVLPVYKDGTWSLG
jgi:hypothetical protein